MASPTRVHHNGKEYAVSGHRDNIMIMPTDGSPGWQYTNPMQVGYGWASELLKAAKAAEESADGNR